MKTDRTNRVQLIMIWGFMGLISGHLSMAETLTGEFVFTKKAPKTGLIYFSEDQSLSEDRQTIIDQIDKQFTERLAVGRQGSSIVFRNSDSIDHNIFANDLNAEVDFDVGLVEPESESVIPMEWEDGKVVRIGCKIHPRMRSYIANISSAYYQIMPFKKGKTSYEVSIDKIPSEFTKITVWMPRYDPIELTLPQGESKEIELIKKGKIRGTLRLNR